MSDSNLHLPHGTIVLWTGNIDALPKGWFLCDGTNGTPHLLDHLPKNTFYSPLARHAAPLAYQPAPGMPLPMTPPVYYLMKE